MRAVATRLAHRPRRRGPDAGAASIRLVPETAQAFRLTEDQILLRDAVRTLADEQIRPRAAEIDKKAEFPHDVKDLLARQDIFGLPFSEEYGGVGADLLTTCIAIEELSRVDATSGLILAVQELAALPIVLAGTDDQKRTWLPDIAAGRKLIAFALTESAAGSDPTATKTRAIRSDDGSRYTLDGSKRFISHASVADLLIVFAVSNPDAAEAQPAHERVRRRDRHARFQGRAGSSTRWASAARRRPS